MPAACPLTTLLPEGGHTDMSDIVSPSHGRGTEGEALGNQSKTN